MPFRSFRWDSNRTVVARLVVSKTGPCMLQPDQSDAAGLPIGGGKGIKLHIDQKNSQAFLALSVLPAPLDGESQWHVLSKINYFMCF